MGFGRNNVHVSKPLSDFAVMYAQKMENFIADQYFTTIPSMKMIDKYFTFDRTNWQYQDGTRGNGSEAVKVTLPKPSTDAYEIKQHSFKDFVPVLEQDEADAPLDPKQDTAAFITEKLYIEQEYNAAKAIFTTTAVGGNTSLATASKWDYTSSTTPLNDVDSWLDTVQLACGMRANVGVTNAQVFTELKRHAQLLDLVKYVQGGVNVDEQVVGACLGLDKLLVGKPVYMSTGEGVSETVSFIWGKYFLVSYQNQNPRATKKQITHAMKFIKQGKNNIVVKDYWDEAKESDVIEGSMYYDFKVPATLCGYLAKDVIA